MPPLLQQAAADFGDIEGLPSSKRQLASSAAADGSAAGDTDPSLWMIGVVLCVTSTIGGTAGKQLIRYGEMQRLAGKPARAKFAGGLGLLMNVTVGPLFVSLHGPSLVYRRHVELQTRGLSTLNVPAHV